jgi:transposase
MDVYIGMDISLQTTHLCAVDRDGNLIWEGSAPSEVSALTQRVKEHGGEWEIKRLVFETGQLSTMLFHGLKAAGLPVVCIDARHAHGMLKAQRVKTDRTDARGLAQIARTGWYNAVHVKSVESLRLRTLIAGRKQLLHTRQAMENHIRGTLKTFGIKLGVVTTDGLAHKVKAALKDVDAFVLGTMASLLKAREELLTQEKALEKRCKQLAGKDEVCQRLMTIPGVGTLTALAFKSEIDDPARFAKSRDVGVHVGLTPRKYASGEIDYDGAISRCGNPAVRTLLFEAAVTMLARSKKWSRLKAWGVKLAQRSSFKKACTAVARKLATVMHRMWVDGTEFAYGAPETSAA